MWLVNQIKGVETFQGDCPNLLIQKIGKNGKGTKSTDSLLGLVWFGLVWLGLAWLGTDTDTDAYSHRHYWMLHKNTPPEKLKFPFWYCPPTPGSGNGLVNTAPLRQYLYFCTRKVSLLRQYLYFCTSKASKLRIYRVNAALPVPTPPPLPSPLPSCRAPAWPPPEVPIKRPLNWKNNCKSAEMRKQEKSGMWTEKLSPAILMSPGGGHIYSSMRTHML